MVDLRIADGLGEVDLFQLIAEAERPRLRIDLVAGSRLECIVVALLRLFQLSEDLLQRAAPDSLLGLGRNP